MKGNVLKGSVLIVFGAFCYGMLGTLVKLAYKSGFNTAEVTISQFLIGVLGISLINLCLNKSIKNKQSAKPNKKSIIKLIVSGSSLGLTSVFYYLAVKHISVSIAIVLLVQAIWLSMVWEMIKTKSKPPIFKIVAILTIIGGTILCTNLLLEKNSLDFKGILWGALASLSYTATIISSSHVANEISPLRRSLFMVTGGLIVVLIIFNAAITEHFSISIFWSWGLSIALFGTILPPILFASGMPLTGAGLGAIFTSLEVPISVISAHFFLNESVNVLQWIGILLIISAVIMINKKRTVRSI